MIWTGHVARIGEISNAYQFWLENLKGGGNSEELGVDGRVILKLFLKK
jgi:hypothetical protein